MARWSGFDDIDHSLGDALRRMLQVNFQEFVETVVYTTNSRGEVTFYANSLVRLVAAAYVKKNDISVSGAKCCVLQAASSDLAVH